MDLQSATRNILKKDSVASIKSEGLLGDKYVEITFGSNEAARLNNGDTIAAAPPLDIADLIQKTNQILDTSQGAIRSINGTADNLKSISAKINQGQGTVGALSTTRPSIGRLARALRRFRTTWRRTSTIFCCAGSSRSVGMKIPTS